MKPKKVVKKLNDILFEIDNRQEYFFNYHTDGYNEAILLDELVMWDNINDGRKFIEEINDYEPLLPYIQKRFNAYVDALNKLKFDIHEK